MTTTSRIREGTREGERVGSVSEAPPLVLHVLAERQRIVRGLTLIVLTLGVLSLAGQVVKYYLGFPTVLGLVPFLYVDQENNLPTWYQSAALLGCAGLLAVLGFMARRSGAAFAPHWTVLSVIFLLLSIDETGGIHERSMEPMQRILGQLPGMWKPTWVILGLVAVVVVCIAYLRFFLHLSWRERGKVSLAVAMFVGGALGVEMGTAHFGIGTSPELRENFTFVLIAHLEEMLEMGGIVVFIDFLLDRIAQAPPLILTVTD